LITLARLKQFLAELPGLTIALVGDLFLDRYLEIDPGLAELSVETGLEAYQVTRIRNSPGALGTVMNNLAALGVGRLLPVTVIGDDGQAFDLLRELSALPVDPRYVLRDPRRLTPTYTKPLQRDSVGGWRELHRIDLRNAGPISRASEDELLAALDRAFRKGAGLIVLDQVNEPGWGVITPRVRRRLAELAARAPRKLMFIDSRAQIANFKCGTLKPNLVECQAALGRRIDGGFEAGRDAAVELSARTGRPLFCTLGERGMLVVRPGEPAREVPGFPVRGPVDIVGAGDSATAGVVSALLAGATEVEAATVGNLVASITVQQLGTTGTANPKQVIARWRETHSSPKRARR
jgi:rfaE bifunctional protein kinase chain/domain